MPRSDRRVCRCWLAIAGAVAVLFGLAAGGLFFAGHLLVVDRQPVPADVGVVLAGSFSRAIYAADLYHQGLIPRIWVTRPERERGLAQLDALGVHYPRQEEISRAVLLKKGVPEDRIELIGEGLLNTIAEARVSARLLKDRPKYRSLLVITSRFHIHRAEEIFRHVFRPLPSVTVHVVGTPYDGFIAERWWEDRDSARQVVLEMLKLAFFWGFTEY